jgi:hypothetical protein
VIQVESALLDKEAKIDKAFEFGDRYRDHFIFFITNK